ncbi:PIN domain-containing protein [Lysobacter sp. ESA13C]|uniref:PIN-like domain-containing protein n=1 Tax=Lysobacter sp. ESA13C TaxID=2862676 RepID=UPI001CBD8E87|nr:PIN domain-containing protein [Lysobacter sp. ESA13C]
MKSAFPEYYIPKPEEFGDLWREATIVLDTNVLLEIYALPKDGREALLGLLRELKERIWIPHQVGLEFQRNRLRAIASERDRTSKALERAKSSINGLIAQIQELELDKRGIDVEEGAIVRTLEAAREGACAALGKANRAQLELSLNDPIRDELDEILEERIGEAYSTQSQLDDIFKSGSVRYANKVPPGFEDESKDDDSFPHGGLTYLSKFGDLLLWKQLLSHAKQNDIRKLIFVTLEKKGDWWALRDKAIIGPHPELLRELSIEAGVSRGWIIRLPDFMIQSNNYLARKISAEAIDQVESADANRPDSDDQQIPEDDRFLTVVSDRLKPINLWFLNLGYRTIVDPPGYGVDLLAMRDNERIGVELIATLSSTLSTRNLAVLANRITSTVNARSVLGLTSVLFVILLPTQPSLADISKIRHRVSELISSALGGEMADGFVDAVVGINVNGTFVPLSS